jgi:hypothetical protein
LDFFIRVVEMAYSVFSFRSVRLMGLVALLGAGLLSGASKAGVVNINLTGYTGDNAGVPVGGTGIIHSFPDFTDILVYNLFFTGANTLTGLQVGSFMGGAGIVTTGNSPTDVPVKFGAAATIGASLNITDGDASFFKNNSRTAPDFGPNSFLGFRTASGQFGYIEVTWTGSTNTFRLISAAYESTPGVAIQTPGGQAPVPEPASALIASLFLGGAALKRWRSKRT